MTKEIVRYQSDDGSEWKTLEAARERDALLAEVAEVMAPLGPDHRDAQGTADASGQGFVRHDPATVALVRQGLLNTSRRFLGDWMSRQETAYRQDLMKADPVLFLRLLDGSAPPVERAWGRLRCIDGQGREWGQPYYASHPDEAEAFEIPTGDTR